MSIQQSTGMILVVAALFAVMWVGYDKGKAAALRDNAAELAERDHNG